MQLQFGEFYDCVSAPPRSYNNLSPGDDPGLDGKVSASWLAPLHVHILIFHTFLKRTNGLRLTQECNQTRCYVQESHV